VQGFGGLPCEQLQLLYLAECKVVDVDHIGSFRWGIIYLSP
jgi:hypothetical protein